MYSLSGRVTMSNLPISDFVRRQLLENGADVGKRKRGQILKN